MSPFPAIRTCPSLHDAAGKGLAYRTDEVDPAPEPRQTRNDVVRLDATKMKRTPQGGVKGPAAPTKVGVFRYRRKDGSIVREYRPAEEVFAADSLASLNDAPITDMHPAVMVDTANHSALSKGHVRDPRQDGGFVMVEAVIQDASLASKVLKRERTEISCGYNCRLDATPGIFEGQAYDVIQRNITYNHVALLPAGTGRQGADVALRFDAAIITEIPMLIHFDGKDYDLADETQRAAYNAAVQAKLATANTRADTAEGARDAAIAELAPYKAQAVQAARTALETSARKVLGAAGKDVKFDGMTDRQVRERVVGPEKCIGKTDDYVNARFDSLVEAPVVTPVVPVDAALTAGLASMQPVLPAVGGSTIQTSSSPAIYERWKEPLTASKDRK